MTTPNAHHTLDAHNAPHAAPAAAPNAAQQQVAANVAHGTTDTHANAMHAVGAAANQPPRQPPANNTAHAAGSPDDSGHGAGDHGHNTHDAHHYTPTPSLPASRPQKAINNSAPYAGLAAATGLVAGASSLSTLPVIGNIPYLPQVAGAIQQGISSVTGALNLNTGALATNSFLAAIPSTAVGTVGVGAFGLWLLGKANERWTGRVARSGLNPFMTMWNGVRAPVDMPIATTKWAGRQVANSYKYIFGDKAHGKKGLISRAYGSTKGFVSRNMKAGLVGAAAGIFLAPVTGGSSLLLGATGFGATKLMSKSEGGGDAHAAGGHETSGAHDEHAH